MTPERRVRTDAATAGMQLVGTIVVCGALGFGLGALVGLVVPLGLAGVFVGVFAGLAGVFVRYRHL